MLEDYGFLSIFDSLGYFGDLKLLNLQKDRSRQTHLFYITQMTAKVVINLTIFQDTFVHE
jgi:hypothetical protein